MNNPPKRQHGDRRMHEGRKPGLDEPRDPTREEEPVRLDGDNAEGALFTGEGLERPDQDEQPEAESSALGGHVATRSSTAPTRPEDVDEAKDRAR